jgi:hypothetical protein
MITPEETQWDYPSYERTVIDHVWTLAQVIPGNDDALWRKDEFGAWMHRLEYGNRRSQFGWEIYDPNITGSSFGLRTLRPMQWQNYQDQIAFAEAPKVSADGLRNVRRLL